MITPTEEQIRAETQRRISKALAHIQRAQDELHNARNELSSLCYADPQWKRAGTLYDQVHSFWYRVDALQHHARVRLDSTNIGGLARRMSEAQTIAPAPKSVT